MEKPRYPKEWLNLRLEFKEKDLENPPIIIKHDNPLKPVSILKNPNEKITDFNDKKSNKIFCNSSQCILM